jgi:hypothetical protein
VNSEFVLLNFWKEGRKDKREGRKKGGKNKNMSPSCYYLQADMA